MKKTLLIALFAAVASVGAWLLAPPQAGAGTAGVPDVYDEIDGDIIIRDGVVINVVRDCPYVLERRTRKISQAWYISDTERYLTNQYDEDTWRDCDGWIGHATRIYYARQAPEDFRRTFSDGCQALYTRYRTALGQRTRADGRTEYLSRWTSARECGGQVSTQQWSICGPIQTVTPEILERAYFGQTQRVVYRVRVTSTRDCNGYTQRLTDEYWTGTVPATVPAPSA